MGDTPVYIAIIYIFRRNGCLLVLSRLKWLKRTWQGCGYIRYSTGGL